MSDEPYRLTDTFPCAPGMKLEAHENMTNLRFGQLRLEITRLEAAMEQLERRLWLTVFGVVGAILAQAFEKLLNVVP